MRFFDAVIRYETRLWAFAERSLKGSGSVSLADLEGLRAVAAGGNRCRVHEVSHGLGITIGAASKLVDRLERAGLVVRSPNPDDGRSSYVSLTEDGERRRVEAEGIVSEALAAHLATTDVDVAPLITSLDALRDSLASHEKVGA